MNKPTKTSGEKKVKSEKFYKVLLDSITQPVITTDEKFKFKYWNKAAHELFQWEEEEILGKSISDFLPVESSPRRIKDIKATLQKNDSWTGEVELRKKNDTSVPSIVSASPVTQGKSLNEIIIIITDLTAQEDKEHELEKLNKVMIGRELKMIELKKENEELRQECEKLQLERKNH